MSGTDGRKPKIPSGKHLSTDDGLTQSERFIKAAEELGTDDDPERFKETVRKVAKTKEVRVVLPAEKVRR